MKTIRKEMRLGMERQVCGKNQSRNEVVKKAGIMIVIEWD